MRRILLTAITLLVALPAMAETLPPLTLKDQWDRDQVLDERTVLVIHSRQMEGSKWVRGALDELKIGDLPARHWLYVANIAKMPALVSRMVAIPKMRDYAFPVALARDDNVLQGWPAGTEAVTVYKLRQREIVHAHAIGSEEELRALLRQRIDATAGDTGPALPTQPPAE